MTFSGLRRMLEHDGLSIVVLGLWAVALAVALPSLLVQDTWLDLVDGRLVAEHGLPHVDTLTLWTLGRRWTDQQWGAHLALYGIVRAGGLKAAIGFDIACVVGALAILAITAPQPRGLPSNHGDRLVSTAAPDTMACPASRGDVRSRSFRRGLLDPCA
jgi:hypothetical protein